MMPLPSLALSIFSCNAPEDAILQQQFEKHLTMLKQTEWVTSWSGRDISAGAEWRPTIDHHLQTADLLLLFVSADFLQSEYCDSGKMNEALRRHRTGEARVIPILLRPVEWKQTPFGTLQALPRDGRPVTLWQDQDEAFEHIAQEIRGVVEQLRQPVVLVSSASNQPFRELIARDLTEHGMPLWKGEATQEPAELKEHIRAASAVVVIASPDTEHAHVIKEATRLAEMYQRPVLGVWVTPEAYGKQPKKEEGSLQPSSQQEWIVTTSGQEQSAVQELRTSLQKWRIRSPHPSQEAAEINQEPRNPYKGLRAFTANDAGDFFGRTMLVDALAATVKTILSQEKKGKLPARLLALVGASGSGKSSIVQAGLLPALHAGKVFESETWTYLAMITPKTHPLDELAQALFDVFPEKNITMLRQDLTADSTRELHFYATALARRKRSKQVVLVVDQFEEIFTLTEQEHDRQQFIDLLVTACTKQDGPLIIILTLRGDFYDRLMQYPALYQLVAEQLTPMLPMTLPDLRAVITQPAKLPDVHVTFEGDLVGDLLFEMQGQIGALPLLQFTLDQLFERRVGQLLTVEAYQEIGGIRGALAKHAEACYRMLPSDEHRELARTLFLRLLDPGTTEQETTRRRATRTEFEFVDGKQARFMEETLNAFVNARLLTITANERTAIPTIEVSHEALIREWPQLVNWLHEARDDIALQQTISRDATVWERNTRSGDRLYQGTELKEAQAWAKRNTVSKQEQAFLKASATRQLYALLTVIGVILLVFTSSGIAGWFYIHRPPIHGYVTTTDEYAIGSLRWAIANANAGDTITFAPNLVEQTITLKYADIHIFQKNLTIRGPATGHLTIREIGASFFNDAFTTTTIWNINFRGSNARNLLSPTHQSPLIQNAGILTLNGGSISGNITSGTNGDGSGITNSGTLTLNNSSVSGNTASHYNPKLYSTDNGGTSDGGGIYNNIGGTLTLNNSSVSGNTVSCPSSGGGIYNRGNLILTNSSISQNRLSCTHNAMNYYTDSVSNGGGIYNKGNLTLNNSSVSDNSSSGSNPWGIVGSGGGIYNNATLTLTNSSVSGNTASGSGGGIIRGIVGSGGGIYNNATLTLTNSSVSGNTASGSGGGIYNGGSATFTNGLVSDNTASGSGGGIISHNDASNADTSWPISVTLVFCTIINNHSTNDPYNFGITNSNSKLRIYLKASIVDENDTQDTSLGGAVITSGGYNIIQQMSSGTFIYTSTDRSVNDLSNVFHKKDIFIQTYQLIPNANNPAFNIVPFAACTDAAGHRVPTDQRGMQRPGKGKKNCDSGAYEYQESP